MPESTSDVTGLLRDWSRGDRDALDRLAPLVFDELRRLARAHFQRESVGHTLQPTELVSELFVRLLGRRRVQWRNRAQFFQGATELMRYILVGHARRRRARRRGGGAHKVPLEEARIPIPVPDEELLELHDALENLARENPERRYLVELKFYFGLTHDEIARLLGVSRDTVKVRWTATKARLYRELNK